jgi:large subunit ribosomal protein L7/L12
MPTTEEFVEMLNNAPISQIAELRKALEETWGVKAAPQVVQQAPAPTQPEPKVEEQTEFSVVLVSAGEKKIEVIKVVRTAIGLGLAEAKTMVDGLAASGPKTIKESMPKAEAEALRDQLVAAGAKVELK